MNEKQQDQLVAYLAYCRQVHERMVTDGTWPWPVDDSTLVGDLVDSEDDPTQL